MRTFESKDLFLQEFDTSAVEIMVQYDVHALARKYRGSPIYA